MVEIEKGTSGNRPQTICRLTRTGRKRFLEYIAELERVISNATDTRTEPSAAPENGRVPPGRNPGGGLKHSFASARGKQPRQSGYVRRARRKETLMKKHSKSARDRSPYPRERPQPLPPVSATQPASCWSQLFALTLMQLRRASRQRRRQEAGPRSKGNCHDRD